MTEGEDNKANLTIDDFLGETETVANDLTEEAEEMFNNLITRATGKDILRDGSKSRDLSRFLLREIK